MIAALMVYALVISVPLAAAAMLFELAAVPRQWPRRAGWAVAIATALLLVLTTSWQGLRRPVAIVLSSDSPGAVVTASEARQSSGGSGGVVRVVRAARGADVIRVPATVEAVAQWSWVVGTALAASWYGLGVWTLRRRRHTWRKADVQGAPVWLAVDDGPAVLGAIRPVTVLPEWALSLEPRALALMMRHEREHERARDPLLLHAATAVVIAMPWNPIVWWMVSRLRVAVELDCDARVLGSGGSSGSSGDSGTYAELLISVAARRLPRRLLAAPGMIERSSSLTRRIAAMYQTHTRFGRNLAIAGAAAALAIVAAGAIVPVPVLRAQSEPQFRIVYQPASNGQPSGMGAIAGLLAPTSDGVVMSGQASIDGAKLAGTVHIIKRIESPSVIRPSAQQDPAPTPAAPKPDAAPVAAPDAFGLGAYKLDTPGLVKPRVTMEKRANYTAEAMRQKIQGIATVEIVVLPDGHVGDARIVKSLDKTYGLDEEALKAASQWVFEPARLEGNAVAVIAELTLTFVLH